MRLPTRPALVRLAHIHQAIGSGQRPNVTTLARQLEVNPRTVQRDLDCLRDQLAAPIEYDSKRRGYYYTDATFQLMLPSLTEGECLALFLADRLLQQYRGTALADDIQRLFQKITAFLPDSISLRADDLAKAYSVRAHPADPGDAERFRKLLRAARDGRQLELLYWSASRDDTLRRTVDPYHVAAIDGDWYLIAHCHLREEVRLFAPGRIRELSETGERFQRPADFRVSDYLDVGFRKMRGAGAVQTIHLRFAKTAAHHIRERKWHKSQELHDTIDGCVELTLRVNCLVEIKRWVMSFGAECEVLEPVDLRQDILSEVTRMQHQNAGSRNTPCQ